MEDGQFVDKAIAWDKLCEQGVKKNADIKRLREVLKNVKMATLGDKLFIGVISESGCWSVEISGIGREIFQEWDAERRAALAATMGGGRD